MSESDKSQRRYIAHAAHKTIGGSVALSGVPEYESAESWDAADGGRPVPRVCIIGEAEHLLPTDFGLEYHQPEGGRSALEELDECDCLLLIGRATCVSREGLDCIKRHCRRGRPIVAVRIAGRTLPAWPAFDIEVLGAEPKKGPGLICRNGPEGASYKLNLVPFSAQAEIRIVHKHKDHPVLEGVQVPLCSGNLPKSPRLVADADVLLTGIAACRTEPVAWTRLHQGGRVFCTLLGSAADFRQSHFPRLLANAIRWTSDEGMTKHE